MANIYAVTPLVPDIAPVLPDSKIFYKVAPLFDVHVTHEPTRGAIRHGALHAAGKHNNDRLAVLEQKQQAQLAALKKLQEQVHKFGGSAASVRGEVVSAHHAGAQAAHAGNAPFTPTKTDVPVQTSPAHPAVVTLAVAALLQEQGHNFGIRHFWHSSNPKPSTPQFVKEHQGDSQSAVDTRVSFIWGNTDEAKAWIHQVTLEGDVNIARLLCRLHAPDLLKEDDPVTGTQVDAWITRLDAPSSSAFAAVVRQMNSTLGKSQYLCGSALTLADIAAWAKLRGQTLDGNVKAWYLRVSSHGFAAKAAAALP